MVGLAPRRFAARSRRVSSTAAAADLVLGQEEEFARLLGLAAALRLPHGMLLEGAPGTGKSTASLALALALLDDGSNPAATRKQVLGRQHPDLHWLAPPKDRVEIPVEDVRQLQTTLACRAFAGRARVAILDPVDRLNEQGQNALLKTLEEPGEATFLILVTSRPEGLLPTVRSRVARYRLRPLSAARTAEALVASRPNATQDARAWAASVAAGSLGFAQDLVDEGRARDLHARLVGWLRGEGGDAHELLAACLDEASGKEALEARCALVLRLLRVALRQRLTSGEARWTLASGDGAAYRGRALDRWIESCERVFETEVDVRQHIAVEQALLALLLELEAPRAATRGRTGGEG